MLVFFLEGVHYNGDMYKTRFDEKGNREYQAREIIREAKVMLVKRGCPFYLSKGRVRVPKWAIEEILGYELETGEVP